MDVLVADKLDALAISGFGNAGFKLHYCHGLAADGFSDSASQAGILVVRSTLVSAGHLARLPSLALIIRAGAGTDTIDLAACAERGILVSNCPGKNADAVAEMALGLLLAADRRIVEGTEALRRGEWSKGTLGQGTGLKGRMLGIIGMGSVGMAMARKALGLEMRVKAWSRSLTPQKAQKAGVEYARSLVDLARNSDAVSLHLASTDETRKLIGASFFAALKPGALFVNTSRGEVVDRQALIDGIRSRGIRAGLDVFAGEPKGSEGVFQDAELAGMAVCTPHLGASTVQASEAVSLEVVRVAAVFRETGVAPNLVLPGPR